MGIVIETPWDKGQAAQWQADRDLWLNADRTKAIESATDPEAAFFLVQKGNYIPRMEALRIGALKPDPLSLTEKPKRASKTLEKSEDA